MASDVQPPAPETAGMLIAARLSPHENVGFSLQESTRTFVRESRPLQEEQKDMNSNAHKDNSAPLIKSPQLPVVRPQRKRRHSSSLPAPSNHNSPKFSSPQHLKRRRKTTAGSVQSMKFLLGGNISDPLNLNSLVTGDPNAPVVSPYCSPAPLRNKDPIPVIIPKDITDPLNLNAASDGEDNPPAPVSVKTPKSGGKKKKRHRSHQKKGGEQQKKDGSSDFTSDSSEIVEKNEQSDRDVPTQLEFSRQKERIDKIVSPVLDAFDDTSPRARQRKRKQEPSAKVSRSLLRTDTVHTEPPTSHTKQKLQKQTSREQKSLPKFHNKGKVFQYGNYNQYYGKRNPEKGLVDERLRCFRPDWFEGKDVLDIGCNIGHITICIARDFEPRRIVGIDIDGNLISIARKNIRHYLSPTNSFLGVKFPVSENRAHGPIAAPPVPLSGTDQPSRFPNNVLFKCCNYVLDRDELLALQKPEYDVILCLSVTKWIHLNWGDDGLKRMFKRIYMQLKPGGRLVLEPQMWQTYARKKKLSETVYRNYKEIKLRPGQFTEYLLSKEVGFSTCELIDTPVNPAKGFRRPIMVFRKSSKESPKIHSTEEATRDHRSGEHKKAHGQRHQESSSSTKHAVAMETGRSGGEVESKDGSDEMMKVDK